MVDPALFSKQYKNHLSGFSAWEQKKHAGEYVLFPENIGKKLSIDETSLSKGELYTIVTNKDAKGRKGSIVAVIKGTKAETVSDILRKIPGKKLMEVEEVTLDMAKSMDWIVTTCFMNAEKVIDRFHGQQLVSEALQEMRIKLRWEAIEEESMKKDSLPYKNGDRKKQLLARSRYLLFKTKNKWSESQKERAEILFKEFPVLEEAYNLSMQFRSFYEYSKTREDGKERLNAWYEKVRQKTKKKDSPFNSFAVAMKSIQFHEGRILNYCTNRATNASAESFNAKIKGFRSLLRGVTDKKFFLFRLSKIYA